MKKCKGTCLTANASQLERPIVARDVPYSYTCARIAF